MAIRPPQPPVPAGEGVQLVPSSFSADYPHIAEYLTSTMYADGTFRETSTLVLSFDLPSFKAALNDRDQSRSLFVSGATPDEALARLEVALGQDACEWRGWKGGRGKGGRR